MDAVDVLELQRHDGRECNRLFAEPLNLAQTPAGADVLGKRACWWSTSLAIGMTFQE